MIILLILTSFSLDYVLILLGEIDFGHSWDLRENVIFLSFKEGGEGGQSKARPFQGKHKA